ncbi:MAG: tetratricopeptide repeat protein [Candidatus Binatia bacterium]
MAAIPYGKIMGTRHERFSGALWAQFSWRILRLLILLLVLPIFQACAPARPTPSSTPQTRFPQPGISSASKAQKPTVEPKSRAPIPDEGSLVAKITVQTSPQRAVSLRLTEEGKRLIETGQYGKAMVQLEKTLAIDSTNPYVYYYLAKAHFHVTHYRESLDFLDVAESHLSSQQYWFAKVQSLRGKNFHALGFLNRANSSYIKALRLNPKNREASEGLARIQREIRFPPLR